jgi:hypothetical protein
MERGHFLRQPVHKLYIVYRDGDAHLSRSCARRGRAVEAVLASREDRELPARASPTDPLKCKRRNRQPVANNRDSAEAGASMEYGNIRGEF